jgi:hypothetical protein
MEAAIFAAPNPPTTTPDTRIVGQQSVAVETQVSLADGRSLRMANFFHLGPRGLIQRLSVYRQG